MCGKRLAAWKYRPSGIMRAASVTKTSLNSRLRDTVPRMPIGSQGPLTCTPGASAGTARYIESRMPAPGLSSVHSTP